MAPEGCRTQAAEERYRADPEALETGQDLEIVTLEAESIEKLEQTHGSCFPEETARFQSAGSGRAY
ncbi:MAG TPA: hypothetical protein VNF24_01615 [Candidatus Acidoferrales bacterium]|nr:hypothetical protein [Candidatus Acidoferrales bacterium]